MTVPPSPTSLLILGRAQIRQLLTVEVSIALVREAMIALSRGETLQPVRRVIPVPGRQGVFCSMQGSLGVGRVFGTKCISVMHDNAVGTPSHQGLLLLHDAHTGAPIAVMEAGEVTSLRTAAASAVATVALSRANANTLAVLGYGTQARAHVRTIAKIRKLDRITVWGPSPARAEAFARDTALATGIPTTTASSAQAAVADASIVCTLTSAKEPILHGRWLARGAHVNLVGSSTANTCEADADVVTRARYFVDERGAALEQAAEFLRARESGLIDDGWIVGEIGAVLDGRISGRLDAGDITVYKSLGTIAQDLQSGVFLYKEAAARKIGTWVEF